MKGSGKTGINEQPRSAKDSRLFAHHVEITAQFRTLRRARRAASAVAQQARSAYVVGDATSGLESVLEAFPVEMRNVARTGILFGLVGAALFVLLAFVVPALRPASWSTSRTHLLAIGFLITGLAGAAGWLAAALYRLYHLYVGRDGHELKAVVAENTLADVEQALMRAGAQAVWVRGSESELRSAFD